MIGSLRPFMFFCTGCQNVQAIEPVAISAHPVSDSPASAPHPDAVPVCDMASERDASLAPCGAIENDAITDEHPPLPPSTPDSEASMEDEGNDMRMPVNRVASSFDESIYSQQFTVHTIPSSDISLRVYNGLPDKYVTIDTTGPVTLSLASLRRALNSIEQDPEKKRLEGSLLFVSACLVMSLMFHYKK